MYGLGIVALLGLAALATVMIAERFVALAQEFWAALLVGLGIAVAWMADLDLFGVWHLAVRNHGIAVTLTGFAIGGVGYFWREILRFFIGFSRKTTDEAAVIEKSQGLRRVG
ncbi:MAG: hypothetical protein HOW97_39160 [Catenulispora sp.]|nr:hypothetical protein [Catenulispora sp.]